MQTQILANSDKNFPVKSFRSIQEAMITSRISYHTPMIERGRRLKTQFPGFWVQMQLPCRAPYTKVEGKTSLALRIYPSAQVFMNIDNIFGK